MPPIRVLDERSSSIYSLSLSPSRPLIPHPLSMSLPHGLQTLPFLYSQAYTLSLIRSPRKRFLTGAVIDFRLVCPIRERVGSC